MGLLLVPSGHALPHPCEGPVPLLLHRQDAGQAHLASGPSDPQVQPKQLLHSGEPSREGTFPPGQVAGAPTQPSVGQSVGRPAGWGIRGLYWAHSVRSIWGVGPGFSAAQLNRLRDGAGRKGRSACHAGWWPGPQGAGRLASQSPAPTLLLDRRPGGKHLPPTQQLPCGTGVRGRRPQSKLQASPSITGWRRLLLDRHTAPGPSST